MRDPHIGATEPRHRAIEARAEEDARATAPQGVTPRHRARAHRATAPPRTAPAQPRRQARASASSRATHASIAHFTRAENFETPDSAVASA
jgi:hypothetical protein